ncbi:hypothetical protein HPB52_017343 [Rhipicephalus sanguineus]|uniref:Uncharacterized protein n=1 Tax=Rhipicephalus sanguineus TaxID=34632 RepID=A0A9D4SYV9_RHISA|nr:hypothetical protein HPB52_017343 [Rhipicephalus sanguineus]
MRDLLLQFLRKNVIAVVCITFLVIVLLPKESGDVTTEMDFYGYVCGSFRGQSQLIQTADLVTWMKSMNLDLSDHTRLEKINPAEMMVRCSLDLGVPAIVSFELLNTLFVDGKRGMKVEVVRRSTNAKGVNGTLLHKKKANTNDDEWLKERSVVPDDVNQIYYASLLRRYGVVDPRATELASSIAGYEIEHQWASYFSKYTNNTYKAENSLIVQQNVLSLIVELLKAQSVGEKGLRYLVAFSVYRQLMKYTVPHLLVGRRNKSDACYEHAEKAMRVAVTSPYYQTGKYGVSEDKSS